MVPALNELGNIVTKINMWLILEYEYLYSLFQASYSQTSLLKSHELISMFLYNFLKLPVPHKMDSLLENKLVWIDFTQRLMTLGNGWKN